MTQRIDTDGAGALSKFQLATAQYAFRRLFLDADSTRRFLVADETGLGKTHVARHVIAQTLDHLQQVDCVKRIDIVYVCSNADIAAQNIRKLNVTGSENPRFATRLSLLITRPELLTPREGEEVKPVTFVAFTPATSFQFGRQMGRGDERAVLYAMLREHLSLKRARATAAQRIFQGGVSKRKKFLSGYVARVNPRTFEPNIREKFIKEFDQSCARSSLLSLIEGVVYRRYLTDAQHRSALRIVGDLRRMLARASVNALEPDLVILDEFQRFRALLDKDTGGEAAELAADLFHHPDAHMLLLSATPYKPFTYAEEAAPKASHYADFVETLKFLADSESPVDSVHSNPEELRQAALSGEPTAEIRDRVQADLRKWIARTERPPDNRPTTTDTTTGPLSIHAEDFSGYVALRRVADAVKAPLSVEYWKSAPYFLNFLNGYRVGEKLHNVMKDPDQRRRLTPLFHGAQRIAKSDVERFKQLDWANARMRTLAAETLSQGWWRLLWMPPSLPYHLLGGPYESIEPATITKRLIFSSWVAAPTAIASLLSYEVERKIFVAAEYHENTPTARRAISTRLTYRMAGDRPASMSTLALFWPHPQLASHTDPLDAARDHIDPPSVNRLLEWARDRIEPYIGPAGDTSSTASAVWHWFAPVSVERGSHLASELLNAPNRILLEALARSSSEQAPADSSTALDAHVGRMRQALADWDPESERPADLLETSALIGLGAPGNIAWRALNRLRRPSDQVTELGQWRAAAIIASGLWTLFSRPDATLLLDKVYEGPGDSNDDDAAYWQKVARYCVDGDLQAALDEYLHHLTGESGSDTFY